jgi:hypothetical protein
MAGAKRFNTFTVWMGWNLPFGKVKKEDNHKLIKSNFLMIIT